MVAQRRDGHFLSASVLISDRPDTLIGQSLRNQFGPVPMAAIRALPYPQRDAPSPFTGFSLVYWLSPVLT